VQEPPQANSEFLEQWNQMKCVISVLMVEMSDLKIASNETRLELADHRGQLNDIMAEIGYRKKHNKNHGFCMQGTILAVVVLIIGLVLGSYITAGLSKKFE
jgi:ABC-type lipoprotein release transport system permease subunit